MTGAAVSARGLTKDYLRPVEGAPGRRFRRVRERFRALEDLDLDVPHGQVLGVVGRNGAGKSTLLKILAGIVYPDAGAVDIDGRVGSLLEVGAGFHPELTGRENVELTGAILGMRRKEVRAKLDSIVDFSGIEGFLETPVKRYSSGMYVRLAFAVAAHLDTEVLLLDEVLAVGDAAFQAKCLDTVQRLCREEGRTVLFVSHNMVPIRRLCDRAIVLDGGQLTFDGDAERGVFKYLATIGEAVDAAAGDGGTWSLRDRSNPWGADHLYLQELRIQGAAGTPTTTLAVGEPLTVVLHADDVEGLSEPDFGVRITTELDLPVATFSTQAVPTTWCATLRSGKVAARLEVPAPALAPGRYVVDVSLRDRLLDIDVALKAATFEVVSPEESTAHWRAFRGDGAVLVPGTYTVVDR